MRHHFAGIVSGRIRPLRFVLGLGVLLGLAAAREADASVLVTGSNYSVINIVYTPSGPGAFSVGGGSINTSTLDGKALPYLYCVDIATHINAPGTYATTDVTLDGKIRGNYVGGSAAVAGQIAWLLNNYAPAADTKAKQGGLQAAIWKVQYGAWFSLTANNHATTISWYNTALAALGTNKSALDSVLWLSPWNNAGRTSPAQGQITARPIDFAAVPEPATVLSALAGTLGLALARFRRRTSR